MKIYKIRHHDTKLFRNGRYWTNNAEQWNWTNGEGKSWKKLSNVKAYLTRYKRKSGILDIPPEWEVVEYELIETQISAAAKLSPIKP